MAREPYVSVADCFDGGEWFVDFKRPLSVSEFGNWNILLNHLQTVPLNVDSRDSVRWVLDQKGLFNTKSLYRFLSNGGFPNRMAGYIWKCKIPLKIKFFLWQMFNNKLPVGGSLIKRGWKGSGKCILSDELETVDHIFFHCFLARLCWNFLREIFNWDFMPKSLKSLSETWLWGKGPLPKRLVMFIFAGFSWALWTTRNKMAIEHKFPKSPSDIMYLALSYLQKWAVLLKEEDREHMEAVRRVIMDWMKMFKPNAIPISDVMEI